MSCSAWGVAACANNSSTSFQLASYQACFVSVHKISEEHVRLTMLKTFAPDNEHPLIPSISSHDNHFQNDSASGSSNLKNTRFYGLRVDQFFITTSDGSRKGTVLIQIICFFKLWNLNWDLHICIACVNKHLLVWRNATSSIMLDNTLKWRHKGLVNLKFITDDPILLIWLPFA